MELKRTLFHERAEAALRFLPPNERARVLRQIARLDATVKPASFGPNLYKVHGFKTLYVLRATPRLRVLVEVKEANYLITDIVSHDVLIRHFRQMERQ